MYSILRKGLSAVTFSIAAASISPVAHAADQGRQTPCVGIEEVLSECCSSGQGIAVEEYLVPSQKGEYFDMAFADVESFLYIRSEPTVQSRWVGKLYPDDAARIIGPVGEWTHVQSGSVTGYVYSEYITVGNAAEKKAREIIRAHKGKQDNTEEAVQEISVEGTGAKAQAESLSGQAQEEAPAGNEEAFSFAESREEEEARKKKEEEEAREKAEAKAKEEEASGQAVVDYACQFIGNPYVWGGTSLTDGTDCSGFVQSVYKHFGVSLPRTSSAQRGAGRGVSYSEALPGDVICYDGHVGIYMGDGQIVNAINHAKGIGILSATYADILTVRRIF